jgi:hypothetical protein
VGPDAREGHGGRQRWETSVWRDKAHGTLLPVPKRLLGKKDKKDKKDKKGDGDVVYVELVPRDA